MHPILFHIGPVPVYTYGLCLLAGMGALFAITYFLGRRDGLEPETLLIPMVAVGVGGVFGGRLSHLIVEPQRSAEFANFYGVLVPGTPGNIVGIMLGGFLGGTLMRRGLALPSSGNCFAPATAGASVIWRVGCFMGGCCYGVETTLPWAIEIDGVGRHPTMVYEGLFNLLLFPILLWARPRIRRENGLMIGYLAAYAFFRFWLEFIRLYPRLIFGFTGIQLLCLAILAGAGGWFLLPGHTKKISILNAA
jgi:phosphatidylglycerol:prolipoprotein diacylglycerol transferase